MNSITMNFNNDVNINEVYIQLRKLYPDVEIIKNESGLNDFSFAPDNVFDLKNHNEFMEAMTELSGSIDDSTFVEPPEIEYESQREPII